MAGGTWGFIGPNQGKKFMDKTMASGCIVEVKVFLWRLAQQSVPTGDLVSNMNMSTSSNCRICGAEDSWRHSLIQCTHARCVWSLAEDDMLHHIPSIAEPIARN